MNKSLIQLQYISQFLTFQIILIHSEISQFFPYLFSNYKLSSGPTLARIEIILNQISKFCIIFNKQQLHQITIYSAIINLLQQMTQFDSKLIGQAKKTKGYMQKKSTNTFSTWKKKYFIFLNGSLCIFKDQTLQSLQKSLNFSQILQVNPMETHLIQIKMVKKTYFLKAQSSSDQDLWIASINILKGNHLEQQKSGKKSQSSFHSVEKAVSCSLKSTEVTDKDRTQKSSPQIYLSEKITYLLREKQLSRFLNVLQLQKLACLTKEQKFLSRILFIEDRKNGIFFSLSSKSIYPKVDGQLTKQDLIYPYRLNVLYFLPINTYKSGQQSKGKSIKLLQICKCSQILESTVINSSFIKLQVHCQKPVQIQVNHLSQVLVNNLQGCIKKLIDVGKEYWNFKGKLLKNIDQFIHKFKESDQNQLVFYKMVQQQFDSAILSNIKPNSQKKQIDIYFIKFDNLTSNLKNFIDACQIKSPPLLQIKEKFVKLYHKFVYNFLSKKWNFVYKISSEEDLIIYSKKVYNYHQLLNTIHHDSRVKEGCKTLLKIALKNFHNPVNQLINIFTNIQEQSLRILKKVQFQKNNEIVSENIFFSTYWTNFFSIFCAQFKKLIQIPKSEQFARMSWINMHQIIKSVFGKLSEIVEYCKQRTSLISVTNSLKLLKNKKIPQFFTELQKTFLFSYKREKQNFLKELNYQIGLVQAFCVKKLFVITFSSIDKDLLKLQIKNMDFHKICNIVIEQISRMDYILPEVRTAMYDAAFEEVCYFFYVCIVKYENKLLSKDECLSMVNQKMNSIKESFAAKVDPQKIMNLLKDLNLVKQFITCPIGNIKVVTRDLKKVFGSNFTELNLKNLISLRVSSLKDRQYIFQQCRQEIKSSYNSTEEIESFQRESFFVGSSGRQRVSTLTESLMSYCQQFEKVEYKSRRYRTILFGFQDSIKQGFIYRKKIIKNFNTSYSKLFYRLKKGKLFEYDNERSEDFLNCYLLTQLRKCFVQPEKHQCFHLEFEKEAIKLKTPDPEDASNWIQNILQAMDEPKHLISDLNQHNCDEDAVLFQDLSKIITLETKQTNQASQPKQKQKVRYVNKISPDIKGSRTTPKKIYSISPIKTKKALSPSKLALNLTPNKKTNKADQIKAKNQKGGCGARCNLF